MKMFFSNSGYKQSAKRIICLFLTAVLLLSALPLDVIAAHFDVSSPDSMVSSWNSANSNSDASNTFNVTNNIDMANHGLTTVSDKTYTITSHNGSDINHLTISAGDSVGAVVNVQTDVTSNDTQSALSVGGDVTVIVTEDVSMNIVTDDDPNPNYVIQAGTGADITVEGNVTSNDGGPLLLMGSDLTVEGNLITDGQVSLGNESSMTVHGDLISEEGSTSIGQFSGIFVYNESELTVVGKTETPLLYVSGNSEVQTGSLETHTAVVGYPLGEDSDGSDSSTLKVNGNITNDTNNVTLNAAQKSETIVNGNVTGTVYASDNATVSISGTAKKVVKTGNAKVTTKANTTSSQSPHKDLAEKYNVLDLCLKYDQDDTLKKHIANLDSLQGKSAGDLLDNLDLSDAIMISLFQHEDINLSNLSFIITPELNDTDLYHPSSVSSLNERYSKKTVTQRGMTRTIESYDLKSHEIAQYKKNLANSMADVSKISKPSASTASMINTVADVISSFFGFIDSANPSILDPEQIAFLENASKHGLSLKEAKDFLTKYRGFNIDADDMDEAARNLRDMFKLGKKIKDKANVAKKASKAKEITKYATYAFHAYDFAEYWYTNYQAQVDVLDTILKEQPLSPEMFVAASQLRAEYSDKVTGTFVMGVEKGLEIGTSLLKGTWFAFSAAETLIAFGGAVTGLSSKYDALYTAVSQCSLAPVAIEAYKNAIQKVVNGDTSEEALNMVRMTYSVIQNSLEDICNGLVKNGTESEKKYYKNILKDLKNLEIGETLPL